MTKEEFIEALRGFEVLVNSNGTEVDINFVVRNYNFDDWKLKPKTVTVNGVEVPEPLRSMINGDRYWTFSCIQVYSEVFESGYDFDELRLSLGICHATQEAAQAHYDALWLPTRVK